jgi:hypothetical protein
VTLRLGVALLGLFSSLEQGGCQILGLNSQGLSSPERRGVTKVANEGMDGWMGGIVMVNENDNCLLGCPINEHLGGYLYGS